MQASGAPREKENWHLVNAGGMMYNATLLILNSFLPYHYYQLRTVIAFLITTIILLQMTH
jgi:hypothetical protein